MPDVHYPDCVIEADREEIRRMGSLLHRLEDQNLYGKLRDEIRRLETQLGEARLEIAALRAMAIEDANARQQLRSQVARLRNGGKA